MPIPNKALLKIPTLDTNRRKSGPAKAGLGHCYGKFIGDRFVTYER